jgi:hypothetical protein
MIKQNTLYVDDDCLSFLVLLFQENKWYVLGSG